MSVCAMFCTGVGHIVWLTQHTMQYSAVSLQIFPYFSCVFQGSVGPMLFFAHVLFSSRLNQWKTKTSHDWSSVDPGLHFSKRGMAGCACLCLLQALFLLQSTSNGPLTVVHATRLYARFHGQTVTKIFSRKANFLFCNTLLLYLSFSHLLSFNIIWESFKKQI